MSDVPSTASVQPDSAPPAVTDRRPVPRGVLPRGVQTWIMAGVAAGMLAIGVTAGSAVNAEALAGAGAAAVVPTLDAVTAALAALTLTSYVFVYTPMKTRSPLSTLVGSVPGALPPLGGFTAAHGAIAAPGLALFAILFLWQLPHFFAIGWRHRADYGAAGVRILPTIDPTGKRTSRHALGWCLALLPVSLLPTAFGMAGSVYAIGTLALTLLFLAASFRFARETTDERALALFLASIGWLPAVLLLLVLDRVAG